MIKNKDFYNISQLFNLLKICSKNNYSMISIKTSSDEYFELKANEPISKNIDEFLESLLKFPHKITEEHVTIKIINDEYVDYSTLKRTEKYKFIKELNQLSECIFIDNGKHYHIIDEIIGNEHSDCLSVKVTSYFFGYLILNSPL